LLVWWHILAICSILSIICIYWLLLMVNTTGIISLSSFNDSSWIAIILKAYFVFFRCRYLMGRTILSCTNITIVSISSKLI
jgi:hypothetical protein